MEPRPQGYRNRVEPTSVEAYRARTRIPVKVRVEWDRDGEEWIPGWATRWDSGAVWVDLTMRQDRRLATTGVWVRPGDVRRL